MKITELLLEELDREAVGSARLWNAYRKEKTIGSRMTNRCRSVTWQRLWPLFLRGWRWL